MQGTSVSFVAEVALIPISTPSLCEKRTGFSLSAVLESVTRQSSSTPATATPATEATTVPTTALGWLMLLLLMHIATIFLLITTVVPPLLLSHVPVFLTGPISSATVGRHLLRVSSWLLRLLAIHPILRGKRGQELGELFWCHVSQPSRHGR